MADSSLHERLQSLGYSPEQPLKIRKIVSVGENGKRYRLDVVGSKESVVYQIDGNVIAVGNRCDKMVLVRTDDKDWLQVFVELKGVDVGHAIEQLEATLQNKGLCHPSNAEKRARIVAVAFPSNRGNLVMEKAKVRFLQRYGCDLRGLKSNQPDANA